MSTKHSKRQYALDEIRSTGFFRATDWLESIDSTSKSLVRAIKENRIEIPALLIADEQSAGVGRGNNIWWSPSGCLMFSMAVPMSIDSTNSDLGVADLLPLRIGVTIAQCLSEFSERRIKVKWPNDVYVDGRKIAGVLIEIVKSTISSFPAIAVIGIGINCQVDFLKAPKEIRNVAVSLHECASPSKREVCSPENVLVQFVHSWMEDNRQFVKNSQWMLDRWAELSLLDGMWVEVKHPTGIARGLCLGIQRNGALQIQDESLQITEVLSGTVVAFRSLREAK